jgi:hypothetical protein
MTSEMVRVVPVVSSLTGGEIGEYRIFQGDECLGDVSSKRLADLIERLTTAIERLQEWALDKSQTHHRMAHENEPLRTEHIASSAAYRNLADEIARAALEATNVSK